VGPEKFSAIVSDNAASMVKAKNIVHEKYQSIMPIRCIDHNINLITTDICKLSFAKELLRKCMKVVKYFKTSHRAGETLRTEILEKMVKGGGLKSYVKTRWSTAFDCANSVLSCETILKEVGIDFTSFSNLILKLPLFIMNRS
jgi:Protein of unknown function (DUF 659)